MDTDSNAKLIMRFQSLGDNCEFGIVQRNLGAEPMGLARFGAVHHPSVISLLRNKLAGLGEDIEIFVNSTGVEYNARDLTYGLHRA